jgi:replicative DNA helicase
MNSSDAEQSVIGGLLINPVISTVRATGLISSDFSDKNLGILFDYLVAMDNEEAHIDPLSVRDWIDRDGDHSGEWTGFPFLATLAENCAGIENIEVYAKHIRTRRISNEIEDLKENISYSNYQKSADEITKLQSDLADAHEDGMQNIVSKTIDYIDDLKENGAGLSTGFKDIDKLLNGLRNGTLTVIAGRPSMGKSTLAMNFANNISKNKSVLFYSLEMTQVQLMMKIVSSETDIPLWKVERNQLTEDENDRWYKALAEAGDKNMTIIDKGGVSAEDIVVKARQLHGEKSLGVIIVDYLQIMNYDKSKEVSELGNITRALKYLSKELDIPVILLSQLSRGVEYRGNKRPLMSDLRSSGEIEQDADVIIMCYRDEYYTKEASTEKGMAEIIIAKNRMGQSGSVECRFEGDYSKFSDTELDIY